jgi:ATP-dependent helicase/nuclease subunit A
MDEEDTLYSFAKNLVVVASAGTGKTHSLVGVLVHLMMGGCDDAGGLRAPQDPTRIVATTFSRKAAAEIQSRLVLELGRLVDHQPGAAYRESLLRACDRARAPRWSEGELAERARRALDGVGRAQIGTLHGYATSLVRAHALELGLSPGFEVADEAVSRERSHAAVAKVLDAHADRDEDALRSLVAVSGGVDRLMDQIVRSLDRLGEDGHSAAELVYSNDDTRKIELQMAMLLEHARGLERDRTLGAPATALRIAYASGDEAATEDAAATLTAVAARGARGPEAEAFFAFRSGLMGVTNADKGRGLARLWRTRGRIVPCASLARTLLLESEEVMAREALREGILSFGDVLRAARDVLRDRPDVAARVGASIDALLVDEFQDTSRLQRDLVLLLWEQDPAARRPGTLAKLPGVRPRGLLVVGDRKQSIYGFRGADVAVFAELCVGLAGTRAREALGIEPGAVWEPEQPAADFVALRHNRRGADELLTFANAYSRVRLRAAASPPELFEIDYVPATEDLLPPPERASSGLPHPRTTWLRVAIRPSAPTSGRLDEATTIARRIIDIVQLGAPTVRAKAPRWADIAVLALRHETLDAAAYALARAGVPYVVAGKSFYSAREVRDLAAMLALIVNPGDKLALLEVLRGPWAGVRDESLLGLTDPHKGLAELSDWGRGGRRGLIRREDRAAVASVRAVVEQLRLVVDRLGPAEILREAVRALGLLQVLVQLPRGEQRVANVQKLLAIAERTLDARALLEMLNRAADQQTAEAEAATFSDEDDAVRLLTVHASKGLDFPIVFLPEAGAQQRTEARGAIAIELGSGDTPSSISVRYADDDGFVHEPPSYTSARAGSARRDAAERVRLAYVAATRASEAIFFVGDRRVPSGGATDAFLKTTAGALALLAEDDASRAHAQLEVVEVPVPGRVEPRQAHRDDWTPAAPFALGVPAWRSLSIATTSLQDFQHCARRFQLAALLGMPERFTSQSGVRAEPQAVPGRRDARAMGTLAHRVLERADASLFGRRDATKPLGALVAQMGVAPEDEQHADIVERVARFLRSGYAQGIAQQGAQVWREQPFVLRLADREGRAVLLRGTVDLLVSWPDGSVDVVDYKRARVASAEPYGLQLDAYVLAADELVPGASNVRAGLVFLGSASPEPIWRVSARPETVREQLASLGARLVEARWREVFPPVERRRCDAIRCGYVGLCHPEGGKSSQLSLFGV